MESDQQYSCSLCYFIGTHQEFEKHKRCALHGFNFTLKYFTDSRKSIVKNKHGVEINAHCKTQDVSHMDNLGTNIVTLYKNDSKKSLKAELEYRITNVRSQGNVYLKNILELHPQQYFKLYHVHQDYFKNGHENNVIEIKPKKKYSVKVKFTGSTNYISTYRMPLAFSLQIDKNRSFTLIREMVVTVQDLSKEQELEQTKNLKHIYTGKSWSKAKIIPANIQSNLDTEYMIPKKYHIPILKFLKLADIELHGENVTLLKTFENLFDADGPGMTQENYFIYCSAMMWMEETIEDRELRKYNMEAVTLSVSNSPMNADVTLEVPGLAEKRPSLVVGDRAHIRIHQDDHQKYKNCVVYEGVISKVLDTAVEIDEFNASFLKLVKNDTLVDVRFVMSRLTYERIHRALSYHADFLDRLFPRANNKIENLKNGKLIAQENIKINGFSEKNETVVNDNDVNKSCRSKTRNRRSRKNNKNACSGETNKGNQNIQRTDLDGEWKIAVSTKSKRRNRNKEKKRSMPNHKQKWITEFTYLNKLINENEEQKLAIENIVNKSSGTAPYILFGPPGTGKTVTIVEAIVQIIKNLPGSKILVCAPANMACDMLTCKLIKFFDKSELIRVHSATRDFSAVPKEIYSYSNLEIDDRGKACGAISMKSEELYSYDIVVCTLMLTGKYTKQKNFSDVTLSFTHLVIDEAAQSMETETVIPLGGLLKLDGQLILAGDPKQLGPICQSNIVKHVGLGISLMERLMSTNELYESKAGYRDPRYITKLVKNFRSHPDIIKIPNKFFYDNELQPCSREAMTDPIVDVNIMDELVFGGTAIEFYGVCATESRQGRSPSFFNDMEKNVVMLYIKKLLVEFSNDKRIKPPVKGSDIGVISPYIKQVYKIKSSLEKLGGQYNDIEVGSTEAFQGREKRIMIISTVRGRTDLLEYDKKYNLGFLVDEKRFNVALTRAKSKLIIIGNPLCLCYNEHWFGYMEECFRLKRYLGYQHKKRNTTIMDYIQSKLFELKIKEEVIYEETDNNNIKKE